MSLILDWLIMLVVLTVSLFVVWRGTRLAVSPDQYMKRYLGAVVRDTDLGRDSAIGIVLLWMWRVSGVVMAIGGLAFSGLMITTMATGGFLPEPAEEPRSIAPPVAGSGLIMGSALLVLGVVCLAWPTGILALQAKALSPTAVVRDSAMPTLTLSVRLGGSCLVILGGWSLFLWLTGR